MGNPIVADVAAGLTAASFFAEKALLGRAIKLVRRLHH
jgi:hypothetical protein